MESHPIHPAGNKEGWKDCYPTAINLRSFQDQWLPGMDRDQVLAALYAHPDQEMTLVSANDLRTHLQSLNEIHAATIALAAVTIMKID